MARITFSPIMVEASGKVGDAVFSRWKGIPYIRSRVTPANPQTEDQMAQRNALKHTLTLWQSIKTWAKAVWNLSASGYAMSGYNRHMDVNIPHTKDSEAHQTTLANPKYEMMSNAEANSAASGMITLSWQDLGGTADDVVRVLYRLATEWAWTQDSNTTLVSAETHNIQDLTPAGAYEVAFMANNTTSLLHGEACNALVSAGS